MSPEGIQRLLLYVLLGVIAIFLGNMLLLFVLRAVRFLREHELERTRLLAAPRLADYLLGGVDLDTARRTLAALPRRAVATLLREHARIVSGETLDLLEQLYYALGTGEEDRRRLGSRFWWVQLRAAQVFCQFTFRGPLDPLVALLGQRRLSVRLAAARALGRVGTEEALSAVLTLLGRAPPLVVIEVVSIVRRMGPLARGPLLTLLSQARDPAVRADAAQVASQAPDPAYLPSLLGYAWDEDPKVVVQAARALGSFVDPATPEVLRGLLGHPAWQVRAQAAKSLGRIVDTGSAAALARAMTDSSWWVRHNAAVALQQIGPLGLGRLRRMRFCGDAYAAEMAERVLRIPVHKGGAG
jgi:HEAT repeat protein